MRAGDRQRQTDITGARREPGTVQVPAGTGGCGRTDKQAEAGHSSHKRSNQLNCPYLLSGEKARACGESFCYDGVCQGHHCSESP